MLLGDQENVVVAAGMSRCIDGTVVFMSQYVLNVFMRILTSKTINKMRGKYNFLWSTGTHQGWCNT